MTDDASIYRQLLQVWPEQEVDNITSVTHCHHHFHHMPIYDALRSKLGNATLTWHMGNSSARARRPCAWCRGGDSGGLSGKDECFRSLAQLDLHVLSHASLAAITFLSNYGQMLMDLQLFKHGFCSVALPADNYFHLGEEGFVYLQQQTVEEYTRDGAKSQFAVRKASIVEVYGNNGENVQRTSAPLIPDWVSARARNLDHHMAYMYHDAHLFFPCMSPIFGPSLTHAETLLLYVEIRAHDAPCVTNGMREAEIRARDAPRVTG